MLSPVPHSNPAGRARGLTGLRSQGRRKPCRASAGRLRGGRARSGRRALPLSGRQPSPKSFILSLALCSVEDSWRATRRGRTSSALMADTALPTRQIEIGAMSSATMVFMATRRKMFPARSATAQHAGRRPVNARGHSLGLLAARVPSSVDPPQLSRSNRSVSLPGSLMKSRTITRGVPMR